MNEADQKEIQQMIDVALKKTTDFKARKIGDNPIDGLQLTPRQYVTMNGSILSRPIGSLATIGQFYLSTNTNMPMWFNSNKQWINGVGSVVASN